MACSFHPFPRLPIELQVQIWDAACLSYIFYDHREPRMHYIDVEPSADSNTLLAYHRSKADVVEGDDKSGSLVHALWTTCSKSREAASRYWRNYPYGNLSLPPARLSMPENEGIWDAPVCPTKDIFCIKSKTWKWKAPDGNNKPWRVAIPHLSPTGSKNVYIKRIGFEFDPTWNIDLPGNYDDLASENSARGCFLRFFYRAFFKYATEPDVYLIEKSGQWTGYLPKDQFRQSTFCKDYDTDYALMQPFYKCFRCQDWHESGGAFANVRSFINKLEELCELCEPDRPNTKNDHYVDLRWIKRDYLSSDCVRYIARLDKKIEDCVGPQVNMSFPLLPPTWDDIWDSGFM
ncbi:hypothetical protein FMUND_5350 [Fusarium mundagurra]|uniref:2EXR domain-containing protein n=1 Tax=Fusarium mundagurra TaxID=1567541 RepID=A0A8H5YTD8_9HYPO|nr:hypothetical protein FMUND_5350 [Fusarium mundagurra]